MDQDPTTQPITPEQEAALDFDMVVFNDTETGKGSSGMLFKGEDGTELDWETTNKYIDRPDRRAGNTMIVLTKSGNQYLIGRGVIVNYRTGVAYIPPRGAGGTIPNIVFGQPWSIPGAFETSEVDSVLVKYKIGQVSGRKVDQESPFPAADALINQKIASAAEQGKYL